MMVGYKDPTEDPIETFVERMYWTIYDPEAVRDVGKPAGDTSNWLQNALNLEQQRGRKVAIVATLPREIEATKIGNMNTAGVDVFRLNFAHGKPDREERFDEYKDLIQRIRGSCTYTFKILADLAGPKIRIGRVGDPSLGLPEAVRLEKKQQLDIQIVPESEIETKIGTRERVYTSYQNFIKDLIVDPKSGRERPPQELRKLRILLGDGDIILEIKNLDKEKRIVSTEVAQGGNLSSNTGITIPGVTFSAPALRKIDIENLVLALLEKLDLIGLSFVKKPEEVQAARYIIKQFPMLVEQLVKRGQLSQDEKKELIDHSDCVKLVAKIELQKALDQLDSILEWVDGVMVARGDLALNTSWPELPTLERRILKQAKDRKKFAIVATQLLYTLCDRKFPARSEIFDVHYAIHAVPNQLPSCSACMLSEETARGSDPVRAVEAMDRLIKASLSPSVTPHCPRDKTLRPNPLVRQLNYNNGRDVAIIASLVLSQELLQNPQKFLDNLVAAGVDVFRLNLSIGDWEKHKGIIKSIRRNYGDVKIMVDFQGPKMMICLIGEDFEHGPEAWLRVNDSFTLTKESLSGDATIAQVKPPADPNKPHYIDQIIGFYEKRWQDKPPIILGDCDVILSVEKLDSAKGKIATKVIIGGRIYPGMGITVPGFTPEPLLSSREEELLKNAVQMGAADMVAISFVRNAQDVKNIRKKIVTAVRNGKDSAKKIRLVAKIESKKGLVNLNGILDEADGVMVSRGDLYLALQPDDPDNFQILAESLIKAQNDIISKAQEKEGKFSIVATGMLSHMVSHRLPLRSEPIDIFYAVESGCSACMLLTETTAGEYAVEAVKTLDQIIKQVLLTPSFEQATGRRPLKNALHSSSQKRS